MKNLFTILFCNLLVTFAFSQAPEIEWDKTIGGIGFDRFNNIGQTFQIHQFQVINLNLVLMTSMIYG